MERQEIEMAEIKHKLEEHLAAYALHREEYLERQAHQDDMQEANIKAIENLTQATSGLVNAWTVANGLNAFVVWASKFTAVGALAIWAAHLYKK